MPSFLQPDLQQILSQAISFVLLLIVLKRFAWKPLLGVLDQRRERIEQEANAAAKMRAQLEQLQAEYRQRLAKIEEEARTTIQQAVKEGKKVAAEIQEQARVQGEVLLAKSKEAIEMELAKARVALRDQMAGLTMEAVERILRQKLDAQADRKLVDAVLDEMEKGALRA